MLANQEFSSSIKLNPYKVVTDDNDWQTGPARIAAAHFQENPPSNATQLPAEQVIVKGKNIF